VAALAFGLWLGVFLLLAWATGQDKPQAFFRKGYPVCPRFDLGKITVKEEAAYALSLSGQYAAFFLNKHSSGDWRESDPGLNEQGVREGSMVLDKYHTLES
jgi:hypothetical protein